MADDVEWQLTWLGAEQLGLQEGGPLLLQQLFTTHVVLGEPGESRRGWGVFSRGPAPASPHSHWLPGRQLLHQTKGQTLQTRATLDVYSSSKKSNSLAVSSKKK